MWYMATTARSVAALMRSPNSPPSTWSGRTPLAMAGPITSDCQVDDSVSATRRMPSACERSICWIAAGRMPPCAASSITAAKGSSSSRIRSVGSGLLDPAASRMNSSCSIGTPVRSAISANVTPLAAENRSNAEASRKSRVTRPCRIAAPRPSIGMPAAISALTTPIFRRLPPVNSPGPSGSMIPSSTIRVRSAAGMPVRSAASAVS